MDTRANMLDVHYLICGHQQPLVRLVRIPDRPENMRTQEGVNRVLQLKYVCVRCSFVVFALGRRRLRRLETSLSARS